MGLRKNGRALHFPCECISAQHGYSDPWTAVTQHNLLNEGTKERVLNAVARQPKTIAHLAKELGLSQPAIHRHVNEMLKSELLREATEWEKRHPAENYYEPNFPVIKAADKAAFESICRTMAAAIADLFEAKQAELERAMQRTSLADQGLRFSDVGQFCYASAQRGARQLLEERGVLPRPQKHENGAEWVFWAEESTPRAAK